VSQRLAYKIRSSKDLKRHVCIDVKNENEIMQFLKEDEARLRKFNQVIEIILQGLRNSELYDKEEIDKKTKNVTAMKMFKGGQNIRLYCKEQHDENGIFYVIVAELLKKKKDQKVKGKTKSLIQTVGSYEYKVIERKTTN
jgi:hypothetical protein